MPVSRLLSLLAAVLFSLHGFAQEEVKVKKSDLKKDVLLVTDSGNITLRLSPLTPLHQENFIRLVKSGFYNGIAFHRVIRQFMIQTGDPRTRKSSSTADSIKRTADYTIPAEITPELFHHKGALAAARTGDDINPERKSSGSQFYIVQGKTFTDGGLDSTETYRLKGQKIPANHREVYKTLGGSPHLDQSYTVFGEVVSGMEVIDIIASVKTTGRQGNDRPLSDIRIVEAKLVKKAKR